MEDTTILQGSLVRHAVETLGRRLGDDYTVRVGEGIGVHQILVDYKYRVKTGTSGLSEERVSTATVEIERRRVTNYGDEYFLGFSLEMLRPELFVNDEKPFASRTIKTCEMVLLERGQGSLDDVVRGPVADVLFYDWPSMLKADAKGEPLRFGYYLGGELYMGGEV